MDAAPSSLHCRASGQRMQQQQPNPSSYVYGSLALHISGDTSTTLNTMCDCSEEHALLGSEGQAFYRDGYCIVDAAADDTAIDNARLYIDKNYHKWLEMTKRQDDWRTHLQLDLTNISSDYKENGPILDLLLHSPKILGRLRDLMGEVGGIFYTQIAFRTPMSEHQRNGAAEYQVGAEYHLDGQANASGERFPDHWTVLVGVALVDIATEDKGNFTVFPASHTMDWSAYPEQKRSKTLPSLDKIHKICLRRGDAVFCHVLLPHRGGKNTLAPLAARDESDIAVNIQTQTREMVFFRVKARSVDYCDPCRPSMLLADPWLEHSSMFDKFGSFLRSC